MIRKISWPFVAAIIIVFVLVFSVSPIAEWQIETRASEALDTSFEIDQLDLNVFAGTVRLAGVQIGDGTRIGQLTVDVSMLSLFDGVLSIESLGISGIELPMSIEDSDPAFEDFSLPAATEEPEAIPGGGGGWPVILTLAELDASEIELTVDGQRFDIAIGSVSVSDWTSSADTAFNLNVDLSVNGAPVQTDLAIDMGGPDITVAGMVKVDGLRLADLNYWVPQLGGGSLSLSSDDLSLALGEALSLQAGLDLAVDSLEVRDPVDVAVGQIRYGGRVDVAAGEPLEVGMTGELQVTDTIAASFGRIASINIEAIDAAMDRIAADSVVVSGFDLEITRDSSGAIQGLPVADASIEDQAPANEAASSDEAESAGDSLPVIAIKSLRLTGDNAVRFVDESVEPAVRLELNAIALDVQNISSSEAATYTFSARHPEQNDETAAIRSSGTVSLLTSPVAGDFEFNLARFDLHEIDSYVGGGIRSGLLQLDSSVKINDGQVNATNDIVVIGMNIDKSFAAEGQTMPLSLALNLLKDKNDRVELTVPIEAGVDNLSVGLEDVISTAVAKAARSAAMTYAKFALQPFGSLLLLKDLAESAASPQFAPIEFERGSSALTDEAESYVSKMAGLLAERPGLAVAVCGYATASDLIDDLASESLDAPVASESLDVAEEPVDLRVLARDRGLAVRDALGGEGAGDDQVLSCAPTVTDNESTPRVEIKL